MAHLQPIPWKLFLDDERFPVDDDPDWRIARTVKAAKNFIEELGYPYYMTLDHDLGLDEQTGMDFCHWWVDKLMDDDAYYWNGIYNVHSQNPVGATNMKSLLDSFYDNVYSKKKLT